jgi:hypothetical protein
VGLRIVDFPSAGDPTYFRLKITNGGFISQYDMGYGAGIYEGWCIDTDHPIYQGTTYNSYLYSSYDYGTSEWNLPAGFVDKPQNLDLVNWLVNNYSAGQTLILPSGASWTITYSDLQRVIWMLIDNRVVSTGLYNWNEEADNFMCAQAMANGNNFVPNCNQKIVFIVVPEWDFGNITAKFRQVVIGQPVIGEVEVPCETSGGTAWGDGKFGASFPGSQQWGTYFKVAPI